MNLKINKNIFIVISLLISGLILANANAEKNETRQKARYYYLEGARQEAHGNEAEAFEYFKKAFSLDSTYADASFGYGSMRMMLPVDTLQTLTERKNSFGLMRPYIKANPADLYAGRFYGYLAGRLDTVPEAIEVYERMIEKAPAETYLLLNLSDAYLMNRQPEKAIEGLEKYESIEGKSNDVSLKKMTLYLSMPDTLAAVKEAHALMEAFPNSPVPLILTGNLFSVIGDNDSTFKYLEMAERLSPDNGEVKMALAGYYLDRGDSVAYDRKMYEALLSEDFELNEKLGILSDYLQTLIDEKGQTQRGDYLFNELMEQYPHEADVLDLAARYSGAKGDFTKAREEIEYAIDLNPVNSDYWGQLMRYEIADACPECVVESYEKALGVIDVLPGMKMMYAAALNELKRYEESEKVYGELIHSVKEDLPVDTLIDNPHVRAKLSYEELMRLSAFYNMLGDMYYMAGATAKAFDAYENSLFFYASNALTLNNYAYFLSQTGGDLDKAEDMSRRAMAEAEDNPTYIDTFAWIKFMKKDYREALDYQLKAVKMAEEMNDENPEYYHHLGDIYFMNHYPDEALESWEKALSLDPDNILLQKKVANKTFFFE